MEIRLRTFVIPVLFQPKEISAPAQTTRGHPNGQLVKHLYYLLAVSKSCDFTCILMLRKCT